MATKLSVIQNRCQSCLGIDPSTRQRSIYTKDYEGPCDDSFCYASCEMSSCRPQTVTVCDKCAKEMSK